MKDFKYMQLNYFNNPIDLVLLYFVIYGNNIFRHELLFISKLFFKMCITVHI